MSTILNAPYPASLPTEVVSGDALLRAEVYSVEQLEAHARRLATWYRVVRGGWGSPLLDRLALNRTALFQVIDHLRSAPARILVPAGEWLLDNQHLILDQVAMVRTHLPRGYSRELPRLTVGDPVGMPRVYGLALEYIAHGDARVDIESASRFVAAYQESVPLSIGELWAVPIMLRLALIESLRRSATRADAALLQRQAATEWATRFVQVAEQNPSSLVIAIADLAREGALEAAFVAEIQRGLLGQHPSVGLVLQWIDQRLGERQQTVADFIRIDNQDQAADSVAVANAITSLRGMEAIDWRQFVERLSPVEAALREDPIGAYADMDFATRDLYRHEVERLARRTRAADAASQCAVARAAASLAGEAGPVADGEPRQHVGWWLLGGGRLALERRLAATLGLRRPGRGPLATWSLATYALPILALAGGAAAALAVAAGGFNRHPAFGWTLAVLLLPVAWQAAQLLMDWMVTRLVTPRQLPRLDFKAGIPAEWRTVVVVPTMLSRPGDVDRLLEGLEIRALANEDEHLAFVLLTDFADATEAEQPQDAAILQRAATGIKDLNERHRRGDGRDRFLILHRPRMWNAREGAWMGHERKRGKLDDLNRLLLHGDRSAFSAIFGDAEALSGTRLVITLDTDTRLPRDAARALAGAMAHPLNRPRLDPHSRRVIGGHAVLQPRTTISLTSAARSPHASLGAGEAGIDPYTRAVSDVYQDLFDNGSFVGKGIYDLQAFATALDERFPDNAILSHDLIEGSYARSGLASDVLLVEDHPASYLADMARRTRWIRGDWQLLPWLLPWTPAVGGWTSNVLPALSRWKMLDNLRRSLVPIASLAALVLAWTTVSDTGALLVTAAIVGMALLPVGIGFGAALLPDLRKALLPQFGRAVTQAMRGLVGVWSSLAFLPYEATCACDAILRTLWRLIVSGRHLLSWQTASDAERQAARGLPAVVRAMIVAPLAGVAAALAVLPRPGLALAVLPFALLWSTAPLLAWGLSRKWGGGMQRLDAADRRLLAHTARRTWQYFADLVTEEGHWLPPDNIQIQPKRAVAQRTSPTNIGLALLADLTAYDFGWLTAAGLLERLERELTAIEGLERHRGHLLNWYDIGQATALQPRYVSTVDSGNLAGHLLVLAAGLRELGTRPIDRSARLAGCATTLELAAMAAPSEQASGLRELAARCTGPLALHPDTLADVVEQVRRHAGLATGETAVWLRAAVGELAAQRDELAMADAPGTTLRRLAAGDGGAAARAAELLGQAERLAARAQSLALGMDWKLVLDPSTKLFSIGYHIDSARLDRSQYDLLASECRLASFVAVASGTVDQEHWFRLGRLLVRTPSGPVLASWSGTMFEYLMPSLVMPEEPGTLLYDSRSTAVAEQMRYAGERGIPWGISESAYNTTDASLNWQYRAFGVPGLGLNRSLADDLVVAPYATAMAMLVDTPAALRNLRRLHELGAHGLYGFNEAIDFTAARLPAGASNVVIPSWMVHHQGMILLACSQVLHDAPMQRRFLADPRLHAHQLLLHERPADGTAVSVLRPVTTAERRPEAEPTLRVISDPCIAHPQVQLLSNGRYHVLITSAGGGYSRWGDLALTRWREDATRDNWGQFCYLRDTDSLAVWSAAWQPIGRTKDYEAVFTQARAEFRRFDHGIIAHTEIVVSSEDDVELRRLVLDNRSDRERHIEVTTYAEPVLAPAAADLAHPAFNNLSIETEAMPERLGVLASRRQRSPEEPRPYLAHMLVVHGGSAGALSWETDRSIFLGRGRTPADPQALSGACLPLGLSIGPVLDPALALRRVVTIPAGGRVTVILIAVVAGTRAAVETLCDRYRDAHLADRAFELSRTHGQVVLAQLGSTEADAQIFARLAGALVYAGSQRRAPDLSIRRNRRPRAGLWSYGISGDLPICLLLLGDGDRLDQLRQLLRAHAWWRAKGLAVDLVVLIEDPSVYRQEVTERVLGVVASSPDAGCIDRPGGVFVRRSDQIPEEDRLLLTAVARVVMSGNAGTLTQYADRKLRPDPVAARLVPTRKARTNVVVPAPHYDLAFWNGLGGFTRDGYEYITILKPGLATPAPWCNVLANAAFGSVVSESGAAYTWAGNCHEFRLTPWRCDAVSDPHGEALYIRDEDTGVVWSPTPGPARGRGTYVVRHGFGYSAFVSNEEGVYGELHQWVDRDAPVKHLSLRLVNRSERSRRLTVTCYVEWTLGELRERAAMHVITDHDDGVLTAFNPLNDDFPSQTGFIAASRRLVSWTCDRCEFLGRLGSPAKPNGLGAVALLGRSGGGLDPCGALTISVDLAPGAEQDVAFVLGSGGNLEQARALAQQHRGLETTRSSLQQIYDHWKRILGRLHVHTPDPALNILANGWLPYQVISSRLLARSGFYQSGGAFGFRDQLQDAMSMVHHDPALLRAQLVLAASRQFTPGDVQHWWHPPAGRGVRTHISDDYLWLPYGLCRYVDATGDTGVLDVSVPFLEGPEVPAEHESTYDLPGISSQHASVYEHAVRAVRHGLRLGVHGLPLMGCGDWNDGMNRVGWRGQGESVWLGFFLIDVLRRFAPVARGRGDIALADELEAAAATMAASIDANAWDGNWYQRAWFDDGTPLGVATGEECRIDALPQCWAAITGATDPQRTRHAMAAVDRLLVRRDDGLVQLFDPPFDRGQLQPGYIKGYVPGVRENGGQYTHAAVWTAMGFASLGDGTRALELAQLINPVLHAATPATVSRWRGEPYVMAADVYRTPGHVGRAGWTWYTGSAGWMWRLLVESLLGFSRYGGNRIMLNPCTPDGWGDYSIVYVHGSSTWTLAVLGSGVVTRLVVDGTTMPDCELLLTDDGREHRAEFHRRPAMALT